MHSNIQHSNMHSIQYSAYLCSWEHQVTLYFMVLSLSVICSVFVCLRPSGLATHSLVLPTKYFVRPRNQTSFKIAKLLLNVYNTSNYKVGKNLPANRLKILNNKIELKWLNLSHDSYKIKCKGLFLK